MPRSALRQIPTDIDPKVRRALDELRNEIIRLSGQESAQAVQRPAQKAPAPAGESSSSDITQGFGIIIDGKMVSVDLAADFDWGGAHSWDFSQLLSAFSLLANGVGALTNDGNGALSWGLSGGVTPAPLTKADDTNVTLTIGGTPATSLLQAVSLTLGWTGVLAEARGGHGQATFAVGDILYSDATGELARLPIGDEGQILKVVSGVPSWVDDTGGGGGGFIFTLDLPGGALEEGYVGQVTASGAASPYTYDITSGALPTGLSLNASTGAITGDIDAGASTGDNTFTVRATDDNGDTHSESVTIRVGTISVLLHFDGSDGDTTVTDEAGLPWTTAGAFQLDDTDPVFGPTAGDFNAGDSYLSTPDHASIQFNGGVWTIDCWLKPAAGGGTYHQYIAKRSGSSSQPLNMFWTQSDNNLYADVGGSGAIVGTLLPNVKQHVAWVSDGTTIKLYIGGVSQGTPIPFVAATESGQSLFFGINNDLNTITAMRGQMDEIRITMGVARWLEDFTPPTGPSNYPA